MIIVLFICVVVLLIAMNAFMWKSGAVGESEKPKSVMDRPLMDAKERKAFLKRLRRWKEEGKLNRAEFETVYNLCQQEWDPTD